MIGKQGEDDDGLVEDIYDALDDGEPERALAAARIALHDAPDDPVLHFLAAPSFVSRSLRSVQPALIEGSMGLLVAPRGRLSRVLIFRVADGKLTRIDVVADPARLRELEIAVP